MKLRYKIASSFLVLLVLATLSLGILIGYTSECGPAPGAADGNEPMKAIVYRCYGSPDVLEFVDVEKPVPGDNQLLIRVRAAAVNPYDWHFMRGSPYIMRLGSGIGAPSDSRLGVDFAGTVEAVGDAVTTFSPGDAVFCGGAGALS